MYRKNPIRETEQKQGRLDEKNIEIRFNASGRMNTSYLLEITNANGGNHAESLFHTKSKGCTQFTSAYPFDHQEQKRIRREAAQEEPHILLRDLTRE